MNQEFWKNKKVLVTGHTGFKGSWLSIWLLKLGANVIGYGLDPYSDRDNFALCNLEDKIIDIRGDIRNETQLSEVFTKY
ncbi:MAG TPA: CDP-glucose 4,6-dehydratase, partial [Lachnospiraceae bacterium]|nr:CDP-glucose 4,6-dehydratase [Lachnospiraceae bacterium]